MADVFRGDHYILGVDVNDKQTVCLGLFRKKEAVRGAQLMEAFLTPQWLQEYGEQMVDFVSFLDRRTEEGWKITKLKDHWFLRLHSPDNIAVYRWNAKYERNLLRLENDIEQVIDVLENHLDVNTLIGELARYGAVDAQSI